MPRRTSFLLAALLMAACTPEIDRVEPDPSVPGADITLIGSFPGAGGGLPVAVHYDGTPLAVRSADARSVVATLPPTKAPGRYELSVRLGLERSAPVSHELVEPCDDGTRPVRTVWDRLDPESFTPFPSDYFTLPAATATGRRVSIKAGGNLPEDDILVRLFSNVVAELNQLDGFGTTAGLLVPMDGPLDLARMGATPLATASPERAQRYALPATPEAPLYLVNIDPEAGAERGRRRALIVRPLESHSLLIEPATPLTPGSRYALVLTRDARGPDEGQGPRCVLPSRAYARGLAGGPDLGPGEPGLSRFVNAGVDAVRAVDPTLAREDVALVLPFTTQTVSDELIAARDLTLGMPEPEIVPGSIAIDELASGNVAVRVSGRFRSPDFRGRDRLWSVDEDGVPAVDGESEKRFVLHIPREDPSRGQVQPFPLAIYLHGLAGDLGESNSAARRLATQGIATIATDAIAHESGSSVVSVLAFFNLIGIATSADGAFGIIRDNFRQSTIDQVQLLRLARRLGAQGFDAAAPHDVPDLDTDLPQGILGVSLGGLMGTTLAAVEPDVALAVLFVGGGQVSKLIADSPLFSPLVTIFQAILAGDEELNADSVPGFFVLMQTILERGDPANYAPHLLRDPLPGHAPVSTLLVQVVPDLIVPNSSNEVLARALGLELGREPVNPVEGLPVVPTPMIANVAPGVTASFFQYDDYREVEGGPLVPADHTTVGGAFEPFLQGATFARSALDGILGDGEAPVIIDPFDPEQVAEYGVDTGPLP